MVGDLDKYSQFAAAQSMTIAAANTGGAAGLGAGIGAGAAIGQVMSAALHSAPAPVTTAVAPVAAPAADAGATKFCMACGHSIPQRAAFCPDCGKAQ
jgi:membrane protease subunit (stomatin/prohibitin family)